MAKPWEGERLQPVRMPPPNTVIPESPQSLSGTQVGRARKEGS